MDLNRQQPGEMTPAIHSWASKRFGKGHGVSITAPEWAKSKGEIQIHKPKGRMGSIEIRVTRRGNTLIVRNNNGGGLGAKPATSYYNLPEA